MKKCPFCLSNKELISLSGPSYITFIKKNLPFSHEICIECKDLLDKNGMISDQANTFGFLTSRIIRKEIF